MNSKNIKETLDNTKKEETLSYDLGYEDIIGVKISNNHKGTFSKNLKELEQKRNAFSGNYMDLE